MTPPLARRSPPSREPRRPRARERWIAVLLGVAIAIAAVAGCRKKSEAPVARTPPPLRVEHAGCAAVLRGPACELSAERTVRLWVEASVDAPLAVRAGDAALSVAWQPVRGGRLGSVVVPAGATAIQVEAGPPEARSTWRLGIAAPPALPLLKEAAALRAEGKLEDAARLLREGAPALPEAGRARALSVLGRVALALGRTDEAISTLRESIALHRRAGQRSAEANDAFSLGYLLVHPGRRFAEARAAFEALGSLESDFPEGAAQLPYYQGLLAIESGDVRSALRRYADAEARAERLGMERQRRAVRQVTATALQFVGRDAEALALLDSLRAGLPPNAAPCERAELLTNIGWGRVLAGEAGGVEARPDPVPVLEEALALYRQGCPRPADEANVLVNLALAELQAGRAEAAGQRLEAARRAQAEPGARLALWWLDIEARIALAAGRTQRALGLFARLAELAATSLSPEARWRAALGRAQALERQGDARAALKSYAEAEALLDDEVLRVPVAEGRHSFLRERERGSRAYVALAVKAGRLPEALEVARRARVRVLEGVRLADRVGQLTPTERDRWDAALAAWREARQALDREAEQDWRLSAERLAAARQARQPQEARLRALLDEALSVLGPAHRRAAGGAPPSRPEPGELRLVYYPAPRGWVGFAADERAVTARLLEPIAPNASPAALAAALLEPFRERILSARRLTVVPYGALRAVDFHALPFEGDVLLSARPVAYALGLPVAAPVPPDEERVALVVADPQGNLPRARDEARRVGELLHDRGAWRVRVASGGDASGPAVRAALEEASLFHYAGHGRFAGPGGWDSALLLADGQLTVGDVLALRRVPAWVVLSGCETARAAQESPVESLGLAQVFLTAGARGVVASWRVVDDADASTLMEALYQHARLADAAELPEALRQAQRQLRAQRPRSDWAAFRALVP